jgi:hypothetical protein
MAKESPTSRALRDLRQLGFIADKVEQRLPKCFITRDLFGCIDIVAVREGVGILGVQATSNNGGNHSARRIKAIAEPRLRNWLLAGGRFEIWSYAKQGARGERKIWTLRRDPVTLDDLGTA